LKLWSFQITLSANGAFSAEIEDKLADVVDDVSFVQRQTKAQITQFFSATGPTLVIYTFDLYPGSASHIRQCEAHAWVALVITVAAVAKRDVVLNSKAIWGGFRL
jgi:hypothetical protein